MSSEQSRADNTFVPQSSLDPEIQQELDDALGGMSLAEIIDAEEKASRPQASDSENTAIKRGTVIAIRGDDIFVDMGGKSEGLLPASQFEDEPLPEVGGTVDVLITGYNSSEGLLELSRQGAIQAATWESLEVGQIVEGRVTALNTGGLELTVDGIRAFMPISQIELHRIDDLSPYISEKLRCKVIEIKKDNMVVGRRDLLKEEAAKAKDEMLHTLVEGNTVHGVVRTIMPYGAFVDIGGVDGLLHVSDMSYSRIEDPSAVVAIGQELDVVILKIDPEKQKISLGLKQAKTDPWLHAEHKWTADEIITGRVVRLADFGAFVELEEGVDGLIPISELTFQRRVKHPSDVVSEGEVVRVRVLAVDAGRKRISLSLKRVGDDPWVGAASRWAVDSTVEGVVTRVADFGAFVELTAGVEGMVHISELSTDHVRAVGDVAREGATVKAKVLSVDEDARRISLSIKALQESPEVDYSDIPATPVVQPKRNKPLKGGLDAPGGWGSLGSL